MSKPTEITIGPFGRVPFIVRDGDKVLLLTNPQSWTREPPSVKTCTVQLCGGKARQWVKLENGREFDLSGRERGVSYGAARIEAFDETVLAEAQRNHTIWAQVRFVGRWAESANWSAIAACPTLADKLKALTDEIELQQRVAAGEKVK